ncbi:MAG: c-type cytochrome [Ardenticatenaceae bacterium]
MSQYAYLRLLVALGLTACATTEPPTPTAVPVPTLDTAQVALGRAVYEENCAGCHGPARTGASNWATPGPDGLYPPPPHNDTGHTWHHSDRLLYEIIHDGWRDPLKLDAPLRMPAWGDRLSDAEIRALITYFKSLWSEEKRQWQWEVTRQDIKPTRTPLQEPGS